MRIKRLFHPVVILPKKYKVFDLSRHLPESDISKHSFGIGKYNEKRLGTYAAPLFRERNIHMGVDFFSPAGTSVYAFARGEIFLFANNKTKGDYGYTIIVKHVLDGVTLFALYGHLSKKSLKNKRIGQRFQKGSVLGWVWNTGENGGWPPHLHFQLSFKKPSKADFPGVVSARDHTLALLKYPDPRLVLGRIY